MDYFSIGKIVNTHGIKGEVKLYPYVDDLNKILSLDRVFVEKKGVLAEKKVTGARIHKGMVLMSLEGVKDMTSAEELKDCVLKISRDMAVPCEEDEYFVKDLYDMEVVSEDGEVLGILNDILFTGANDVYIVKTKGKDILIPAVKQCILKVDVPGKKMTVRLLEGLRE
ncbi:MAG: ribosome maturation factor RimM [Clostridiales bacterium]|nr:ribosome maturation factor RimM [Clostridiales bacterium]